MKENLLKIIKVILVLGILAILIILSIYIFNDRRSKKYCENAVCYNDECYSYDESGEVIWTGSCEKWIATVKKPVLYLYPEEEQKVTVTFAHPEYLTTTYPKYNTKWQIMAYPNGDLIDEDGKYYYALYWEEALVTNIDFSKGFYVDEDNAIDFLEEKLTLIGLNDKEKNEFIMYWLPILEKNGKSLVYFELTEELQKQNKLYISPEPDSLLRVRIHIKKVDYKQEIQEQKLESFERSGFVAVEWGGTVH